MTRKTVTELYTQATTDFADNVSGAITPAKLRQFCQDFLDTIRPSYGGIALDGPLSKAATTTFSSFVWSRQLELNSPDFSGSLASGTITRNNGPATARISFSIDAQAPNNIVTSFALFVDGVETPWAISNTSTSGTDVQSFAFSALAYSAAANPDYQVRIKVSANNNVVLSNGEFVVENVPVNSNV